MNGPLAPIPRRCCLELGFALPFFPANGSFLTFFGGGDAADRLTSEPRWLDCQFSRARLAALLRASLEILSDTRSSDEDAVERGDRREGFGGIGADALSGFATGGGGGSGARTEGGAAATGRGGLGGCGRAGTGATAGGVPVPDSQHARASAAVACCTPQYRQAFIAIPVNQTSIVAEPSRDDQRSGQS